MFVDWSRIKVFVRPGATDLRKQIDGLAGMVQGQMKLDPFSGHLYQFCNHNRKLLKAVYWERNGFCLWLLCEASHNVLLCIMAQAPGARSFSMAEKRTGGTRNHGRTIRMVLDFCSAHQRLPYSTVLQTLITRRIGSCMLYCLP